MSSIRSTLVLPILAAVVGIGLAVAFALGRNAERPFSVVVDSPEPGVEFALLSNTDFSEGESAYVTPRRFEVRAREIFGVVKAMDGKSPLQVRVRQEPSLFGSCSLSMSGSSDVVLSVTPARCRTGPAARGADGRPLGVISFQASAVRVQFGGMADCTDSRVVSLAMENRLDEARSRCAEIHATDR